MQNKSCSIDSPNSTDATNILSLSSIEFTQPISFFDRHFFNCIGVCCDKLFIIIWHEPKFDKQNVHRNTDAAQPIVSVRVKRFESMRLLCAEKE